MFGSVSHMAMLFVACDLRAPRRLTRPAFEGGPGAITFPPEADSLWSHFSTGPSASRNTISVSTITDGNAWIRGRSTFPAQTLAWLYIEPSPCGGVRPAGDPVDSDPGAVFEENHHPRSDAGLPLEPWVCHHTREPTVLSRVSCRPFHLNVDRFHQPCLLPGRTSKLGEDCRPRTTWQPLTLFVQSGSSSFASYWRFLPRHTKVFAHTQVRDLRRLLWACLGDPILLVWWM